MGGMSAAYTPAAAARPSLKCRICGRAATPGSKLCDECSSAVKRARQVPTVMSQFMPLAMSGYGSASNRVVDHQTVRFRNRPPPPAPATPISWRAIAAFAGFIVAVCVTAYFAAREIEDGPDPRVMAAPIAERVPRAAASPTLPTTPMPVQVDEPAPSDDQHALSAQPPTKPSIGRQAAKAGAAGDATPTIPAGLSMTAADSKADSDPSMGVGAPLPPTPAAVPQEPIVPDRWQAMLEAIARCPRDNFFNGVVCEQRVRLRYCEGHWGESPHCGSGFRFDSGR